MTELAAGSQIDSDTLSLIYDWFQFRRVCDNERFQTYFNRQLIRAQRQYLLLLRNDMTTWDPMVQDYIERLTEDVSESTHNASNTGSDSLKRTGDITHKTTGTDTVKTDGTSGNTKTLDITDTDGGTVSDSGADTVAVDALRTDDLTHTRNTTDTRTDNLSSTVNSDGMANEISDQISLEGQTPDSSTYGVGSAIGLTPPEEGMPVVQHDIGAPEKLNWMYTGAQREGVTRGDRVTRDNSTTQNTGDVTTVGTGDTKDTGTVADESTTRTQYGKTVTTENTTKQDGTVTDSGTRNDTTTTNYGRVLTDTQSTEDIRTTQGSQEGTDSSKSTHKERHSGRREAPPELLRRAQEYIVSSNSFKWLQQQLEPCFFQLYDW